MAGKGELLLRENYCLERDLRPRRRTDDGVNAKQARKTSHAASRQKPTPRELLPMQLQVEDRFGDETGEWEVIGRPYTTACGRTAHVRVRRVGEPAGTDLRTWGALERISVKRATAGEGKR